MNSYMMIEKSNVIILLWCFTSASRSLWHCAICMRSFLVTWARIWQKWDSKSLAFDYHISCQFSILGPCIDKTVRLGNTNMGCQQWLPLNLDKCDDRSIKKYCCATRAKLCQNTNMPHTPNNPISPGDYCLAHSCKYNVIWSMSNLKR